MTRACIETVHDATGRVFSDAEVDDIITRVADRAVKARRALPNLSEQAAIHQAMREVTVGELRTQLIEKRMKMAADVAKTGLQRDSDALGAAGFKGAKRLTALTVGVEDQARGASASTDAEGRAREASLWGRVQIGLGKMPGLTDRLANFWGVGERGFDRLVAKEMARLNGAGDVEPTGDEAALHAARVFVGALRAGREMQNSVGAWIDELPGYIARQTHDPEKIAGGYWRELSAWTAIAKGGTRPSWDGAQTFAAARAFGAWRDFILPRLDERTFAGVGPETFDLGAARNLQAAGEMRDASDVRELMLHRIFTDILTGRHEAMSGADDASDFRAPPSKARQVSEARTLHFKSPDDWVDYNDKFGRGDLYSSVIMQLGRAGKNTALMRRWGPNPELGFEAEKTRLAGEARKAPGAAVAIKAMDSWKIRSDFENVNGTAEAPENMRLASTMRTIRQGEAAGKLGSIILSKTSDLVLSGSTMARAGAGFLAGYRGFAEGLSRMGEAEAKEAAELMDVGARAFSNHLTSAFHAADGPLGWSAWAVQMTYKMGAFTFANEGVHKGIAQVLARHWGMESAHPWAGLKQGTRETFERYGVTPDQWEAARGSQETLADGRTYWGMDRVADEDTAWKFRAMAHELIANATGEARARERVATTFGTKAGTAIGEAVRTLSQLKGFVTSVVGRHLVPAARGYAGYAPAACLAQLILGGTLAGYMSANAKILASGQIPRGPIGADAAETEKIWAAALVQGGGLGLYGDFLFGDQNRNGGEFSFTQLAGPAASDAEQLVKVIQQTIAGGDVSPTTGRSPLPGELVRLASRNIPIVNTWYTRLALDYLVLWRLQEAASPGYLQRYQSRVENQEGRHFILAPTSAQ